MSVFEKQDELERESNKFWANTNYFPEIIVIFRDQLYEKSKNKEKKLIEAILTKDSIIKTSKNSLFKAASIQWKLVTPFIEEQNGETFYGFTLGHKNCNRDFYVNNENSLNDWINHLQQFCIMTDFDNDFAIIKELGKGSFSKVYLAANCLTKQIYAVKAISKETLFENSVNFVNQINEIALLRKVNHPNIIKLHMVYENEDYIHLVLDYAEGGDLYQRILKKNSFSEAEASIIGAKMLDILEYLESMHIVHRDIKLENILLTSKDRIDNFILADFGLAEELKEESTKKCGSPGYVAPEILRNHSYSYKVDVYSTGIVLYILISGKMPFFGRNSKEILIKNREGVISFHNQIWKNKSKNAIDAILKLTEKEPEFRPSPKEAFALPFFNSVTINSTSLSKLDSLKTNLDTSRAKNEPFTLLLRNGHKK
ncbi:unnamed protein product [Blepharisma stoltei]|uniref:Protein kinase domain-containing protein n=1 Tax=Blepharisma stoltei TaxID=1481888 RepID=A0AAU9K8S1_9CILI|nr:unnamed protein product [Blepharisma stoltei]